MKPNTKSAAVRASVWAAGLSILLAASCQQPRFKEGKTLGGKKVSAETLELGYETYTMYCVRCHGVNGDGKGESGIGLWPPPRDFTTASFKFAAVNSGELPRDEDFQRTIQHGLNGTAMLPWNLSDNELNAVIHYIKTFSSYWEEAVQPEPIAPEPDPWKGRTEEAIQKGREVYHVKAQCQSCHAAYATPSELAAWGVQMREDAYSPKAIDAEAYGARLLPPDFLRHPVRAGTTEEDLYRTLYFGVGGTPMASWSYLGAEDVWALVHYVKSLADKKDTAEGRALRDSLLAAPPAPPPEPETADQGKKK